MKYRYDHYTGANVSVMIGPHLLTQCFGLSYNLNQTKRPIYGYRSQYFDAIADGQILIGGQLYLNYVNDSYLPTVLQKYWAFRTWITENSHGFNLTDGTISQIQSREDLAPLADVLRQLLDPQLYFKGTSEAGNEAWITDRYSRAVAGVNATTPRNTVDSQVRPDRLDDASLNRDLPIYFSNDQRALALDTALDKVFNDESVRQDLISALTGGLISSQHIETGENGVLSIEELHTTTNSMLSIIERNQNHRNLANDLMAFARPDQFGNSASVRGFDIFVQAGPPYGGTEQNQIINYQGKSSFVLKDCHFVGEAKEIMANDRPILEVYSFIARKKEIVARDSFTGD